MELNSLGRESSMPDAHDHPVLTRGGHLDGVGSRFDREGQE